VGEQLILTWQWCYHLSLPPSRECCSYTRADWGCSSRTT